MLVAAANAATDAPSLSVCLPEADPPRSVREGASLRAGGFDVDVARLLASKLGRPLRLVWLPERGQTDIESTDLVFWPLLAGQCDMQLSIPGADAIARLAGRLALSEPYYGATFELVPARSTFRWGEPYDGVLAVRANSVAHVAVDAAGIRWTMQERTADIVDALAEGRADAALVWGPNLALTQAARNEDFESPIVLRWNLHAVFRRGDGLLEDVNGVFVDAAVKETLRTLLRRHRIPAHAPFPRTYSREALQTVLTP